VNKFLIRILSYFVIGMWTNNLHKLAAHLPSHSSRSLTYAASTWHCLTKEPDRKCMHRLCAGSCLAPWVLLARPADIRRVM